MKRVPWPVVCGVVLCLVLPALAWAGAPEAALHFGQKVGHLTMSVSAPGPSPRVEQQPPMTAPFCPGVPIPWDWTFAGNDYGGIINAGDHVVGTINVSSFVFLSCVVNSPTTGTCTVSPDGSSISFNLTNVQGPSAGDISGNGEVPPDGGYCGTISATLNLTEPHTFTGTETDPYECNGVPCPIPTLNTPGLAVLALLLAGLAVAVLLRRWRA
jgi:hypothetical protein